MKIQNLLEIIDTKVSTKKYSGRLREPADSQDRPRSGAFSTVKPDKDPHTVIKHNHTPTQEDYKYKDAYEHFVKWLIENKIYNVHFPRIYDVTKIKDSAGDYIYKYQVEALLNYKELDLEELHHVFDLNFDMDSMDDLNWTDLDARELTSNVGAECVNVILGRVDSSFVKNPELLNALKLLRDFSEWAYQSDKRINWDLANAGNIMFRRTGQGLQIVFSDPVA